MRILRSVQSKVCVDGSLMKEYLLDEPLTADFIGYLKNFGEVTVLEHLKKPFLSFEKEYFLSIKGIIGDPVVEVRYKAGLQDIVGDYFHLLLYYYRSGKEVATLKQTEEILMKKIRVRFPEDQATGR